MLTSCLSTVYGKWISHLGKTEVKFVFCSLRGGDSMEVSHALRFVSGASLCPESSQMWVYNVFLFMVLLIYCRKK